jgi:flagellar L-ring protein precursor FlgH
VRKAVNILLAAATVGALSSGCSSLDRLAMVGEKPKLAAISNPVIQPNYRPVSMPMPEPDPGIYNANSLWRSGARAFFKDQRAMRVGDIVTVLVNITDKAEIDNATKRSRAGQDSLGINGFFGLEKKALEILPDGTDLGAAVSLNGGASSDGSGSIEREEKVTTKIAAVVTQVLPNNNLVLEGRQEIRVNYEVREMIVQGVIRPEDITSENTIPFAKIAEARVSYGGRGQITDVQQPRYGQQILDVILPY